MFEYTRNTLNCRSTIRIYPDEVFNILFTVFFEMISRRLFFRQFYLTFNYNKGKSPVILSISFDKAGPIPKAVVVPGAN